MLLEIRQSFHVERRNNWVVAKDATYASHLNQKMCSSKWLHLPQVKIKQKNTFETTEKR